LLAKSDKIT